MKTKAILAVSLLAISSASAQDISFTNFIRQVQLPSGVQWDVAVAPSGEQLSALAINPGGARFELWTVKSYPLTSYLLDTRYVGTYVPVANVTIRSEDPYTTIPRTRADRPFWVDIAVSGLLNTADAPAASKSVKLLRHVQAYPAGGTAANINRNQATLLSQASITSNGTHTLSYSVNSIPGGDRSKVRGEERFSVYSLADYQAPESQLASQYIQIWPVATASISGIAHNDRIRAAFPDITLTLNELYPDSRTYAQIYPGEPQLGTNGVVVPGSGLIIYDSQPVNRVLTIKNWDLILTDDGRYTMEVLTVTPFGIDRLTYLSFDLDRTLKVRSSVTTID
jgi:hypothetical protein